MMAAIEVAPNWQNATHIYAEAYAATRNTKHLKEILKLAKAVDYLSDIVQELPPNHAQEIRKILKGK